eukprot:2733658-Heterocapsa_arctica.AAC.1
MSTLTRYLLCLVAPRRILSRYLYGLWWPWGAFCLGSGLGFGSAALASAISPPLGQGVIRSGQ